MLRHIFYALLGGYFVAGLVIGLNWLIAIGSEPTAVQQAEHVPAPVQSTRTPAAESRDVIDVIIGQALTSQKTSSDNGEASLSPPPLAAPQPPQPDPRTASGPSRDTGTLGRGRPQPSGPPSLQADQVNKYLPTVRAIDHASIPQLQTDQNTGSTTIPQTLEGAQVSGALPTVTALSRVQHAPQLLDARRKPVDLLSAPTQVDTGALPTVTANARAPQGGRLLDARRKPVELVGATALVDTDALPTVTANARARQGGRLLNGRRKPVELVNVEIPSFGGSAEPAATKLVNEIVGISSADSDTIPPKAIERVFTLACSLLRPAITAGRLSTSRGLEIGRMQDDYLEEAECLAAAKRATRIAKLKIGCGCTAETKEFAPAAQARPAPAADYKLLMELQSRSRYFPRPKPRAE